MRKPIYSWRNTLAKLGYRVKRSRTSSGPGSLKHRHLHMESLESRELLATTPTAVAGGPYPVTEGGVIVLDGSLSHDVGEAAGSLTYAWDLDHDEIFGETGSDAKHGDETGVHPTFLTAGRDGPSTWLDGPSAWTVSLRVSDGEGLSSTDTAVVQITNAAPTLGILGAGKVSEGGVYRLDLSAHDAGPDTISQWSIDWGDGQQQVVSGNPPWVEHVYADGKTTHRILATATDEDGTYRVGDPGTLNAGFGQDGWARGNFTSGADYAYGIARQGDGKLVVVGSGDDKVFRVLRYAEDGKSLDASFGDGGIVTTNLGMWSEARAVAIQPDRKIVVAGWTYDGSGYDFALARYNEDGSLDTGFGQNHDGKVKTDLLNGSADYGYALAIDSLGRIVVAGRVYSGGNYDFGLARYTTDGYLDTTFDNDGKATTFFGTGNDEAYTLTFDSSGEHQKILVAGRSYQGNNYDFALAQYTENGGLDTGFGAQGKVTVHCGNGDDFASAVAVRSDGKIVVAGYGAANLNGPTDFALAWLSASGTPERSLLDADSAGSDYGYALALQDTKVVVAGGIYHAGSLQDMALVRYTENGQRDGSFGDGGVRWMDLGGNGIDFACALATDPGSGNLVAAGYGLHSGSNDIALARYTRDGALDGSFGDGGTVLRGFAGSYDQARALTVQDDGKILVAGDVSSDGKADFGLMRFNLDGTLDTSFGENHDGKARTDFSSGIDSAYAVALQSVVQEDGKIVVAGYAYNGSNSYDFALARYTADGILDTTFGEDRDHNGTLDGKVTTPVGSGIDMGYALTVLDDGKILVAGSAVVSGYNRFALTRYTADGILDTGFGEDPDGDGTRTGKATVQVGAANSYAYALAIQPATETTQRKIVLAGYAYNGSSNYDFALARFTDNGQLDTGFGSGGTAMSSIAASWTADYASAIAVQSDGKIVVGGRTSNGHDYDFAVVRYTRDGHLDTTFGEHRDPNGALDGKTILDLGGGYDEVLAVAIEADGKIVAAGRSSNGKNDDIALVRLTADGHLDAGFGNQGKVRGDLAGGWDYAQAMVSLEGGELYVAGPVWSGSEYDFTLARYFGSAGGLGVEVENVKPTLSVAGDQTVVPGQPFTITDLGIFSDPRFDGPSSSPPTSASFTYTIDWGDGTTDTGTATIDTLGGAGALGQPPARLTWGSFDGSHTYAAKGRYPVAVTLHDDNQGSATQSLWITVDDVENWSFDDVYSTLHGRALVVSAASGLLSNDFDPDGSSLTAVKLTNPMHGTVTLAADGSFSYVPEAGYVGTDVFTYKATDGIHESLASRATIQVRNETPTARNNQYITSANAALTVSAANGVLANDLDLDEDDVTASIVGLPIHGTISFSSDGSFTYIPAEDYEGTDSFSYRISDGLAASALATVTVQVGNDVPQAVEDHYRTDHDKPLAISARGVLDNDVDAEQDALQAVLVTSVQNGVLDLRSDGSFLYTPRARFHGVDSFTYKSVDAFGESQPVLVTIEVIENGPEVSADRYAVRHGNTLILGVADRVLVNDSDAEGDAILATLVSGVSHGVLSFHADGAFSYRPNDSFVGVDSFTYRASDGLVESDPVTVTLDVTNTSPEASADGYRVHSGDALSVAVGGVLANDVDADGNPLTATLIPGGGTSQGSLTLNPDGTFTYAPNTGFTGTDRFTYKASDGLVDSTPTTVTIEVSNAAPSVTDLSYSLAHGALLSVPAPGLLAYCGDADGDPLTLLVDSVDSGVLTVSPDGSFLYTPDLSFAGTASFQYWVSDGRSESARATVTLTVTDIAPVAETDHYAVSHDRVLNVTASSILANDTAPDGDALTARIETGPTNGSLLPLPDGSFVYTPRSGFVGTDSFTYWAEDGAAKSLATVTIDVTSSGPSSADDCFSVLKGHVLTRSAAEGVRTNDVDPDGDAMSFQLVAPIPPGLTFQPDGSFTCTPPSPDFTGTVDFTYYALDAPTGIAGNNARVSINVYNDPIVAVNDSFQTAHDRQLAGSVMPGYFNWDQLPLTVALVGGTTHGSLSLLTSGNFTYMPNPDYVGSDTFTYRLLGGSQPSNLATVTIQVINAAPTAGAAVYSTVHGQALAVDAPGLLNHAFDPEGDALVALWDSDPTGGFVTISSNGSFLYTPAPGFVGQDRFTYKVNDGLADSSAGTIVVNVTNSVPTGIDDTYQLRRGGSLSVTTGGVLANDRDADGDILGASIIDSVDHGIVLPNGDGTFTYTPAADFVGVDSFTYQVADPFAGGNTATVYLEVSNTAPLGDEDSYEVGHDQVLVVDAVDGVLANDLDRDGDTLTAELVPGMGPVHGTLELHPDGSFTYTPAAHYAGDDSFSYRAKDGFSGSYGDVITVSITVRNHVPTAQADSYTVDRNGALTVAAPGVLANDADLDNDPLSFELEPGYGVSHGTLTPNSDGSFTYTPAPGYVGIDSFRYHVKDGAIGSQSESVAVTFTVGNTAPEAADDLVRVPHDRVYNGLAGEIATNDYDFDGDQLSFQLVDDANHGILTLNTNGSFTYTPNEGYVGFDQFRYKLSDGADCSDPVTVTLEVYNTAPQGNRQAFRVTHGQLLAVDATSGLLASARDAENDALAINLLADVGHGILTRNLDGSFQYQPAAGFAGNDSFVYQFFDGVETSAAIQVDITVANTAPVPVDDVYLTAKNGQLVVNAAGGVLRNDQDLDGDARTATLVSGTNRGTLTLQTDGSFTYTPATGYAGFDSFTYRASDGIDSEYAQVVIEVTGASSLPGVAPTAGNDVYRLVHGHTLTVDAGACSPMTSIRRALR